MRPPRPERTSLSFNVEIDPPCPGWMLTRGGGMDPPLARGIFVLYIVVFLFVKLMCLPLDSSAIDLNVNFFVSLAH